MPQCHKKIYTMIRLNATLQNEGTCGVIEAQ